MISTKRKRLVDRSADSAKKKKRREYTSEDAALAKLYEDLASDDQHTRLKAAAALVAKANGHDDEKLYIRLVRGLCSNRKSARVGFFTALTEVLAKIPLETGPDALEQQAKGFSQLVEDYTKPDGGASKKEKRDYLLGRASAYGAFIHSIVTFNCPAAAFKTIAHQLCLLGRSEPQLREQCMLPLYEAVKILAQKTQSETSTDSGFENVQAIFEAIETTGLFSTPEAVAIRLETLKHYPSADLPPDRWHDGDPLLPSNLKRLADIMKDGQVEGLPDTSGIRRSSPNFAWEVVLRHATERESKARKKALHSSHDLQKTWREIVDNSLFAASASSERKSLGLQITSKYISTSPAFALPPAFSPNAMSCIINQSSDSERFLHHSAKALLAAILSRVKNEPSTAATMYAALLSTGAYLNFDRLTATKTVQEVATLADDVAFEQIVAWSRKLMLRPVTQSSKSPNTTQTAESRRQILADQLLMAVRKRYTSSKKFNDADAFRGLEKLLEIFVQLAFFVASEDCKSEELPNPPVSATTRSVAKSRLSSCLAHVLNVSGDRAGRIAYMVVKKVLRHGDMLNGWKFVFDADTMVKDSVSRAHEVLRNISGMLKGSNGKRRKKTSLEDSLQPNALQAFQLLLSMTQLQVYEGEPEAVSILDDLLSCYDGLVAGDSNSATASSAIMEIILSFASKPSTLYRRLSEQAFTAFASSMTLESLQSMQDVLMQPETAAGQQALFKQDGDMNGDAAGHDSEDSSSTSSDSSSASDVEIVDQDAVSEEDDSSGSSDCDEKDDGEKVQDNEELERFDKLLASTLGTRKLGADMEEHDDSSSSEDMDDEQMMALEPALTKIMQQRKAMTSKKQENKYAKQNVINFKNRVLDLLNIYIKQQYNSTLAIELIVPLLYLIRKTSTKQLSEKAFALLKQYFDTCKHKEFPSSTKDVETWRTLNRIHVEGALSVSKMSTSASSRSSLFIARLLYAEDPQNLRKIGEVYNSSLTSVDRKAPRLPRAFYTDWAEWAFNMVETAPH